MQTAALPWRFVDPERTPLPRFVPVAQRFNDDTLPDLRAAVADAFRSVAGKHGIGLGKRIAITAGSRGIWRIAEITRWVADEVRALGAEPFVVPAMGSHGGATIAGQLEVMRGYGITEESVGCPIRATMEAASLGTTADGYEVFCDKYAAESDGIILLNRVKPHSILVGDAGSGLLKMLAIGLGKAVGADAIHIKGLQEHFLPAARMAAQRAPVALGIALVENSYDRTARVEAVLPPDLEAADLHLLNLSKTYLPRVPFDPLDVLAVRRLGKDISGAGMDPNVVGMHRRIGGAPDRNIRRITALDLTEGSHGNAIGVGMADIITDALKDKIDYEAMYTNALTSDFLWGIKVPVSTPTEREALALTLRPFPPMTARVALIRDTAHLDMLWVSEALLAEARQREGLEVVGEPRELRFGADGRLAEGP
ncbi:MAG: lactate racemase domain-containing protein [Chloroflexi bacterium]|nr:lactate racemase domain-containing protein [Chloroflexota bacterium]